MNESDRIDLRSNRRYILGIGIFIGMLIISLVQYLFQSRWIASAATLAGIACMTVLYRALEHDMPHGVDTIASNAAHMEEKKRKALDDFLKEDD